MEPLDSKMHINWAMVPFLSPQTSRTEVSWLLHQARDIQLPGYG